MRKMEKINKKMKHKRQKKIKSFRNRNKVRNKSKEED